MILLLFLPYKNSVDTEQGFLTDSAQWWFCVGLNGVRLNI